MGKVAQCSLIFAAATMNICSAQESSSELNGDVIMLLRMKQAEATAPRLVSQVVFQDTPDASTTGESSATSESPKTSPGLQEQDDRAHVLPAPILEIDGQSKPAISVLEPIRLPELAPHSATTESHIDLDSCQLLPPMRNEISSYASDYDLIHPTFGSPQRLFDQEAIYCDDVYCDSIESKNCKESLFQSTLKKLRFHVIGK